jgi:hypothetical protein
MKFSSLELKGNVLINIYSLTELLGDEEPDGSLPLQVSDDMAEDDISSRYLFWISNVFRCESLQIKLSYMFRHLVWQLSYQIPYDCIAYLLIFSTAL